MRTNLKVIDAGGYKMSTTKKQIREELEDIMTEIKGESGAVRRSRIVQDKMLNAIEFKKKEAQEKQPTKTITPVISPSGKTVLRRR